ncbi:MAG: glutathione S-transferase [Proteobacteria bacterium]|nr:glutathione S-transferase [Pseudomonadota bacterium]
MKLYYSPASPFARKVLIAAHEIGIHRDIELISAHITPIQTDDSVNQANPLGKIPALVVDRTESQDGAALYDSRVICEYLDSLHDGPRLIPGDSTARWTALRRQAQGDGIMDAAILRRYETVLRPQALRWDEWSEGQNGKINRALDDLERQADLIGEVLDIGTITIACALGYLDLRFPEEDWRAGRTRLTAWFERFAARPSFQATMPAIG